MRDKKILIPFMLLTATTFILNMSMQMSIPTFSVYLKSLNFPLEYIGAASLAVALAAMFFRPISAILNRKIGSIETGLIGASLYFVSFMLFLLMKDPTVVVMARIIQGIGMGLVITTMGTIISQIVPHDELLSGMNIYSLFAAAAGAIGPFLGMFLIADGSFSRLFVTALSFVTLGILILAILRFRIHLPLPEGLHTEKSGVPILKSRALFPTTLAFTSAFVYAGLASYLSIYGIEVGIPNVGFFFLYGFIGLLLSRLAMKHIMKHLHLASVLMIFGLSYGILLTLIVYFQSVIAWTILGIFFGFVFNFLGTILNTMAVKNVPMSDKASANALLFVGLDSGFFLGGLIWGQVAVRFSTGSIFIFSAVLITVAMWIGGFIAKRNEIKF